MFCDEVKINVSAGNGGGGLCSFRRVIYNAKGGPDGGDGGDGGDVIFRGNPNLNTLHTYRSSKFYKAGNGGAGGKNSRHGARGESSILDVPLGTKVYNAITGELVVDVVSASEDFIVCHGGRGGFGNEHFKSSVRQAPNFAELGEPGISLDLRLELELVADVSIIGVPSAGKSTLISVISDAKPKIADYPFTTIVPNLGVVDTQRFGLDANDSFVICDVPGLIKGASDGKGLGYQFLRHIKRSNVFVHLVDISLDNFIEDYETILDELKKFDANLLKRPMLVVFNKADVLGEELVAQQLESFKQKFPDIEYLVISAVTQQGLKQVVARLSQVVKTVNAEETLPQQVVSEHVIYTPQTADPRLINVEVIGEQKILDKYTQEPYSAQIFKVTGKRLEQIVVMTDFANHEAMARVYDVLKKMEVYKFLKKQNIKLGDIIRIAEKDIIYRGD